MVRAWFMDNDDGDQRLPHMTEPPIFVDSDRLVELGVEARTLSGDSEAQLNELKLKRGYTYQDQIEISPDKLPNYEEKIKSFFDEHIHTDEEIRYIVSGTGYFDIRDDEDNWIRVEVSAKDLLILPAGIYHRFTLDSNNYIKAVRLFAGEPVWTPHSRSKLSGDNSYVLTYRQQYLKSKS